MDGGAPWLTPPPTPPDVQAAREALRKLAEAREWSASVDEHHAAEDPDPWICDVRDGNDRLRIALAHLDTLTARLAVVEGERDAAAATERAAIVADLAHGRSLMTRNDDASDGAFRALDKAIRRIESNAHHEAP